MYRSFGIILLLSLLSSLPSEASWTLVAQMSDPIGCGFAISADTVLIGVGNFSGFGTVPPYDLRIWRTVNGGATWVQSTSPVGRGRITGIYMLNSRIGYASIYSDDYSLWKTTDGGKSWFDITGPETGHSTCVAVTSKALVKTMWSGFTRGGSSIDDGAQFDGTFLTMGIDRMNAIAFADDNNGIATFGPHTDNDPVGCFYTTNGGVSWNRGGELGESWGIYGVKWTRTFIALPEGSSNTPLKKVRITTDGGITWVTRTSFSPYVRNYTGAIAGGGTSVYVQTTTNQDEGMLRSDDLGFTWHHVGGPANSRDTRFIVIGCRGEIVYAFDNQGGVWKTTDGGDGTLQGIAPGPLKLTIAPDTIRINTFYCQPEYGYVTLSVSPCALLAVDSLYIVCSKSEFQSDSTKNFVVNEFSSVTIPVRFQFDTAAVRTGKLHIKGTFSGRVIDTIVTVIGKNATAPEPYIGAIASVPAGDTASIPIYLKATADAFSISKFTLHLSYNTDMLSCIDFDVVNTLASPIKNAKFTNDANGVLFTCEMKNAITNASDLAKPLIKLGMRTYLSRELSTMVRLDTLSVGSQPPQPLCTIPQQIFEIKYECGDSLLSRFIKDNKIPKILSINPNPVGGENDLSVGVYLPTETSAAIDVVDMNGNIVLSTNRNSYVSGEHTITINARPLLTGTYIMRLHTANAAVITEKFLVRK